MRKIIRTDSAPKAVGPYSQAVEVKCTSLVFCSGQIALEPTTGEIVGETAAAQCDQVLKNLKAVLEAAGSGLDQVIKTSVFLANMDDFVSVNQVYAGYFVENQPARAAVEVACLPKDALVMIDAVAVSA
jgi:2-iminobutanoate/2-iminopropanoate deaminase